MARTGIGTIIGRKTASKGKEYARIWVYIPTKVSEDTAFPFKIGAPCEVQIDEDKKHLIVKPISEKEAIAHGWRKRNRRGHSQNNS
ncbi:MAG: hypothetical protein M1540_01255 [Candidatus Bathyarchaeota archaeon]|nr:hypothetical protein [Candidatus Bathyarchaeota archaeon]